jgi:GH25 family lysozyme M1 (1,4-beta-N-acetylmuramidase)
MQRPFARGGGVGLRLPNPVTIVVVVLAVVSAISLAVPSVASAARSFGVDVSHFQGETGIQQATWEQMKEEGKSIAYIKATEGLLPPGNVDPAWATNVANASAAGILTGVYHFARPDNRPSVSGAVQEADHFMNTAGSAMGKGHLRPVMDLERGNALTTTALTDWVLAFVNRVVEVKGPGAEPIIYCNQSYASSELDSRVAGLDPWIASLNGLDPETGAPTTTGRFSSWLIWQYSFTGTAGGISPIDLDVVNNGSSGSLDALKVVVPEPSGGSALLVAAGGRALCQRRRRDLA